MFMAITVYKLLIFNIICSEHNINSGNAKNIIKNYFKFDMFFSRYLKPIEQDPGKEAHIADQLKQMRNSVCSLDSHYFLSTSTL